MPVTHPAGLSPEDAQRLNHALKALGPAAVRAILERLDRPLNLLIDDPWGRAVLAVAALEVAGETEASRALVNLVMKIDQRQGPARRERRDRAVQARADRLQQQVAQLTHEKADLVNELAAAKAELDALRARVDEPEHARAETDRAGEEQREHDHEALVIPALTPYVPAIVREDAAGPAQPRFPIVLRGYDRVAVDGYIDAVKRTGIPAPPSPFSVVLRGYDRGAVDEYIRELRQSLGAQD